MEINCYPLWGEHNNGTPLVYGLTPACGYAILCAWERFLPFTPKQMAFFNSISEPVFNQALGFGTVLQERVEHTANWGPFHLETVTVRRSATDPANTWTQHVETFSIVRDLETLELQKTGTGQECSDFCIANMTRFNALKN